MVDLNYTLFVQLGNFVVLIFVLNYLLFKPVLRHMAERDKTVAVSHEEAKEYAERAEYMLGEFEYELADARVKANQLYHSLQQEGAARQREVMAEAKAKAQEMVEKAKAEIEGEAGRARKLLDAEMEKLPAEIASKLLGRTV
ncbi:MAG TPA: ATP synthase F0 subunit B [Nitrospirota bacterium]|nr:ATP synthase F0 subunit B [Nitrospirota bacterium]